MRAAIRRLLVTVLGTGAVLAALYPAHRARAAQETFPAGASRDTLIAEATYIDSSTATTNYGTNVITRLRNTSGVSQRTLYRWDLSPIPSNDVIIAVHVECIVQKAGTGGFGKSQIYGAYRALKPWVEDEVTWDDYATGSAWDLAGAKYDTLGANLPGGPDSTYEDTTWDVTLPPVSTFATDGTVAANDVISFDLTYAFRRWHSGFWKNDGVLLREVISGSTATGLTLHSNDATTASNRPRAIVIHAPAGNGGFQISPWGVPR